MELGTDFPARLLRLPRNGFLGTAAERLIDRHRALLPDLSTVTVLLPSLSAGGELARGLVMACGHGALLLPGISTFAALSSAWRDPTLPAESAVRRELLLYGVLREHRFVERAALWQAARELRQLADDLSAWHRVPGTTVEEFSTHLRQGYGTGDTSHLQFEARVAFESWRQLGGQEVQSDYAAGLMSAAASASGPLWVLDPDALRPVELSFLRAWAHRHPVYVVVPDPGLDDSRIARLLCAAWPEGAAAPLKHRADAHHHACPDGDVSECLAFHGAATLEEEAAAAALRNRGWLAEGRSRIAIVALDRLVARRLRALLERDAVLVQDETGWALSTVAASTVVARWLDCLAGGFRIWDLLDLLKSPYLFSDDEPDQRRRCAWLVEQASRVGNVFAGLAELRSVLADRAESGIALAALGRIEAAAAAFGSGRRPAVTWLEALRLTLDRLGVTPGLEGDAAGSEVIGLLDRLVRACADDGVPLAFDEWRAWLDQAFESALFRDRDIRSPVVLMPLDGVRLRAFDAVLLLGASAETLPSSPRPGLFLNESVRRQLGLPTHEVRVAREKADLQAALLGAEQVFVTWRARRDGEPAAMGAWLEILDAFHEEAYGHGLRSTRWRDLAAGVDAAREAGVQRPGPSYRPAPAASTLCPERVSVSAWASLVECPYRFHARHMLALNDLDEITEAMDKRDHGELVHRILFRFHRRVPAVSAVPPEEAEALLLQATEEVFDPVSRRDGLARAWASRWRRLIPEYLAFQRSREASGWIWSEGEVVRDREVPLDDGGHVVLHGRLDRLDRRSDDGTARAVLDYKTQNRQFLAKRLEAGDDVQLSSYALLEPRAREAGFVSVDGGEVAWVAVNGDLAETAAAEFDRLAAVFTAIRGGAPLVANGDDDACARCEMRAVCRRDHWSDA